MWNVIGVKIEVKYGGDQTHFHPFMRFCYRYAIYSIKILFLLLTYLPHSLRFRSKWKWNVKTITCVTCEKTKQNQINWTGHKTRMKSIAYNGISICMHAFSHMLVYLRLQIIIHNSKLWWWKNLPSNCDMIPINLRHIYNICSEHMPFHGIAFQFVYFDLNFLTWTVRSLNKTIKPEE